MFFEDLGEYFRQYFFLGDREEMPFNRATRAWVYRMAKNEGGMAGLGVGMGAGVGFGQVMGQAMAAAAQVVNQTAAPVSADDVVATLEKLHGLVEKGILSQAEFDAKKAELLKKLT